ncbi:hypothetical protein D3C81_1486490 [compost metagenome]
MILAAKPRAGPVRFEIFPAPLGHHLLRDRLRCLQRGLSIAGLAGHFAKLEQKRDGNRRFRRITQRFERFQGMPIQPSGEKTKRILKRDQRVPVTNGIGQQPRVPLQLPVPPEHP